MAIAARLPFLRPRIVVVWLAALSACGTASLGADATRQSSPPTAAGSPPILPTAGATMPAPRSASTTTRSAPKPTLQPMAAALTSQTFPIAPLVAGGPSGSVTMTTSGSSIRLDVVVAGLVPGSRHTIHDHLGRCSSASSSEHLTVLATPVANSSGVIDFETTVGPILAGAGRIVIVYSSASTNLITGCADL